MPPGPSPKPAKRGQNARDTNIARPAGARCDEYVNICGRLSVDTHELLVYPMENIAGREGRPGGVALPTGNHEKGREKIMAGPCCDNCVYSVCDPPLWRRLMWTGEPILPRCANHPRWPGQLCEVPGVASRNYRPKPVLPEGDNVRLIPLGDGHVECAGIYARVNFPKEWPPERRAEVYAAAKTEREKAGRKEGKTAVAGRKQRTQDRRRTKAREKKGRRSEGRKARAAPAPVGGTRKSRKRKTQRKAADRTL